MELRYGFLSWHVSKQGPYTRLAKVVATLAERQLRGSNCNTTQTGMEPFTAFSPKALKDPAETPKKNALVRVRKTVEFEERLARLRCGRSALRMGLPLSSHTK